MAALAFDELKLESVKLLACFISLSLQLQNLLLVYITRRKILDNLFIKNSLFFG